MALALIAVVVLAVWIIDGAMARSRRAAMRSPGYKQAREYDELRQQVEYSRLTPEERQRILDEHGLRFPPMRSTQPAAKNGSPRSASRSSRSGD